MVSSSSEPRASASDLPSEAQAHPLVGDAQHQAAREASAANVIQRTYRGYQTRRELSGMGLSASTRWVELVRDVKYNSATSPLRAERSNRLSSPDIDSEQRDSSDAIHARKRSSFAVDEWKRIAEIAKHAGQDDGSSTDVEISLTEEESQALKRKRAEQRRDRQRTAKMMGLDYFLEMVDSKHRYGSHLRSYHAVWKKSDTHQNFFFWLDEGEGKDIELPTCSREKLEQDQVRYLNRQERQQYRINIDQDGRLVWAKDGTRVHTSIHFRDSIEGIVKQDDSTPSWREATHGTTHEQQRPRTTSSGHAPSDISSASDSGEGSDEEGAHYVNRDLKHAKGLQKIHYVSAAAVLNHLLQSTTKKNTWIFVADTSFRLYIGIKQSGAFQHSSFLHGARISAAGLIKVKDGQLRQLSPLSGHYRPPTRNFRAFVHSLKDNGVDMSRVNISRSYAILLGLEGYMKSKRRIKEGVHHLEIEAEKVIHPEQAKEREQREQDKSESAAREREHLEQKEQQERAAKKESGWRRRLSTAFKRRSRHGDASINQ